MRFGDESGRVRNILDHAMRVYDIEMPILERQCFAVGDTQTGYAQPVVFDVAARQINRAAGKVDSGRMRPASDKAYEVGADPAADFENSLVTVTSEVDERRQVSQLVEPVFVQGVEEREGPERLVGHVEVVDPPVPVLANPCSRSHALFPGCRTCRCIIDTVRRDPWALAGRPFDFLVIGGGIYGSVAAWDATLRGLSVAIIDRGDFGSGTSFNSAKTIHGGVRALQSGNVAALRRFARERRALRRIVPHLVRPIPFVIPTCRGISRNRALLRLYFALADRLVGEDAERPGPSGCLPPSRALSRAECLRRNPLIDPDGVTGGVEWFECQMYNSDRVHFSFIASASEAGAVAVNYLEAVALLTRGSVVEGVRAIDRLTGESLEIRAHVVLNAAGPWTPELSARLAPGTGGRLCELLSKAMNFVIASPLPGVHAVAGPADGRFLFVAPWRGCAIVGTSHHRHEGRADSLGLERREIDAFIDSVNVAFPALSLRAGDIRLVHRGLLPASPRGDGVRLESRSVVVDHRCDGIHGLISVLGARYTTARDTAQRAVDLVVEQLARTTKPCRTTVAPLIGGDMADFDTFLRDATATSDCTVSVDTRRRLALTYGTRYKRILRKLADSKEDRTALGRDCAVTAGEVRHAVREEMAVRLSDVVLRRTETGSAGYPGDDAIAAVARIVAAELAWSPQRMATEIAELRRTYQLPG